MLPTIYITDCYDDNTKARLAGRIACLIPNCHAVQFVGVRSDVEAAGNLVDALDALEGTPGVIFLNVAPRGTGRWPNGTPFCFTRYQNTYIFSTLEGHSFSLLQKLSETAITVEVFDIPTTVPHLPVEAGTRQHIISSQFRSYDFLPRVAAAILNNTAIPSTIEPIQTECPASIWWQDNFGNFKTTLLPDEIGFKTDQAVRLRIGEHTETFVCYDRLKDIPGGAIGVYVGSSGLPGKRLIEITKQKGDALPGEHGPSLPFAVGNHISVV